MALTTLANVRSMPTFNSTARYSDTYLNMLIAAADAAIKRFTKRELVVTPFTEYHSGNEMPDIVLRQWPVLAGTTQVASGSNGVSLPTATISVVSTEGFDPGTNGSPTIAVQVGQNSYAAVTYTGVTATTFTGCSGGVGTLNSADGSNAVNQPAVWFDQNAWAGQRQPNAQGVGPFPDSTLLAQGANYQTVVDESDGTKSSRGLIRRLGGYGPAVGFFGGWPGSYGYGQGKLSAYRNPCWPRGQGNLKVKYSAGYVTVPADLTYAATMLVALMSRVQPSGATLSSESLGQYSYSVLQNSNDVPEIGSLSVSLRRYREVSW